MKSNCLLIAIFSFLIVCDLSAQKSLSDEAIKNSPYFFEGKVVKITPVKNNQQKRYVSYSILIKNVLKKSRKINVGDTVELISEWPQYWDFLMDGENGDTLAIIQNFSSHVSLPYIGLDLSLNTYGIFLGKEKESSVSSIPKSCNFQIQSYYSISNCYFYIVTRSIIDESRKKSNQRTQVEGFDLIFNSIDEFNLYLKKLKISGLRNGVENPELKK